MMCYQNRTSPSAIDSLRAASGRFIPFKKGGDLNLEFLICFEFSNAVRKFSLKVPVVADPKSNTKKVTSGLT